MQTLTFAAPCPTMPSMNANHDLCCAVPKHAFHDSMWCPASGLSSSDPPVDRPGTLIAIYVAMCDSESDSDSDSDSEAWSAHGAWRAPGATVAH